MSRGFPYVERNNFYLTWLLEEGKVYLQNPARKDSLEIL